jgi:hypothetical protein
MNNSFNSTLHALSNKTTRVGTGNGNIRTCLDRPSPMRQVNASNLASFQMLLIHSPPISSRVVVEIPSTASVADAVMTLSRHNILSAPVRNVDAPEDASWIDRYLGEFTRAHRHYFSRAAGSPAT